MKISLSVLLISLIAATVAAQTSSTPPPASAASTEDQPAVSSPSPSPILPLVDKLDTFSKQTPLEIELLHIDKWKARSEVRSASQANADSIQRNLSSALPALLSAARSAPDDVSAAFKLYRNVNALYDVFESLTESTRAFGSQADFVAMNRQLLVIRSVRHDLGDALEQLSASTQRELVQSRTQIKALQLAAATPPPAPEKIIVAPEPPKKTAAKKKPAPKKPTTPASTPTPASSTASSPAGTAPSTPKL